VGGMWCSSCALVLEDALLGVDGVLDAEVSYAASLARVTFDPTRAARDTLLDRFALLGYRAESARIADAGTADSTDAFLRFFVGAAVGMWVLWPTLFILYPAFLSEQFAGVRQIELFTAAGSLFVLLYPGWPFLVGAWRAARVGRATMDTLVVLGTWTAWLYSLWATLWGGGPTYFESAAMITTIVLFGRWLESLGQRDAARAIATLAAGAQARRRGCSRDRAIWPRRPTYRWRASNPAPCSRFAPARGCPSTASWSPARATSTDRASPGSRCRLRCAPARRSGPGP